MPTKVIFAWQVMMHIADLSRTYLVVFQVDAAEGSMLNILYKTTIIFFRSIG